MADPKLVLTYLQNIILSIFLVCITVIALVALVALTTEVVHLSSFGGHKENSMNFDNKACLHAKTMLEGYNNVGENERWKQSIIVLRCVLLASPDVQTTMSEFDEFVATRTDSQTVNSALGTIVALVTLVFTGLAWFTSTWFIRFKQIIESQQEKIESQQEAIESLQGKAKEKLVDANKQATKVNRKINDANKHLTQLRLQSEIHQAVASAQHELIAHFRQYGDSVNSATTRVLSLRPSLELLPLGGRENYQAAISGLSPLYYALEKNNCPAFVKLLALCRQQDEEYEELLSDVMYFGDG